MNCTIAVPNIPVATWAITTPNKDEPCGNRGNCQLNNTTNLGFCRCEEGWSGHADFLRFDGITCHVEQRAIYGVYGTLAIIVTFFALKTAAISIQQVREFKLKKQKSNSDGRGRNLSIWNYPAFKVLLPSTIVTYPCWLILIAAKLWSPATGRIGVDIVPTTAYVISYLSFFAISINYQYISTSTLVRSVCKGKHAAKGERIISLFKRAVSTSTTVYFTGRLTTFLNFALPTTLTPLIIVMGLGGTVLQLIISYWTAITLYTAVSSLEDTGSSSNHQNNSGKHSNPGGSFQGGSQKSSSSATRLQKAIAQMKETVATQKRTTGAAILIYGSSCAPPMWPYLHLVNAFGILSSSLLLFKVAKNYKVHGTGSQSTARVAVETEMSSVDSKLTTTEEK